MRHRVFRFIVTDELSADPEIGAAVELLERDGLLTFGGERIRAFRVPVFAAPHPRWADTVLGCLTVADLVLVSPSLAPSDAFLLGAATALGVRVAFLGGPLGADTNLIPSDAMRFWERSAKGFREAVSEAVAPHKPSTVYIPRTLSAGVFWAPADDQTVVVLNGGSDRLPPGGAFAFSRVSPIEAAAKLQALARAPASVPRELHAPMDEPRELRAPVLPQDEPAGG